MTKINVILEVYRGKIENIHAYEDPNRAEAFVRNQLMANGALTEEENKELESAEDVIMWLAERLGEEHEYEIHWLDTVLHTKMLSEESFKGAMENEGKEE
jgi:hypothetical protein